MGPAIVDKTPIGLVTDTGSSAWNQPKEGATSGGDLQKQLGERIGVITTIISIPEISYTGI